MTSRSLLMLAILMSLVTTGCGKSLEDLVRINKPKDLGSIVPFEGQAAIKISPGNTAAVSSDVSMTAHVTITERPLTGSDVAASVSVSRQRSDGTQ